MGFVFYPRASSLPGAEAGRSTTVDVKELIEYGKMAASEVDCMVTLPEEFNMTLDDETKFIQRLADGPNSVAILAEHSWIGPINTLPYEKLA